MKPVKKKSGQVVKTKIRPVSVFVRELFTDFGRQPSVNQVCISSLNQNCEMRAVNGKDRPALLLYRKVTHMGSR